MSSHLLASREILFGANTEIFGQHTTELDVGHCLHDGTPRGYASREQGLTVFNNSFTMLIFLFFALADAHQHKTRHFRYAVQALLDPVLRLQASIYDDLMDSFASVDRARAEGISRQLLDDPELPIYTRRGCHGVLALTGNENN